MIKQYLQIFFLQTIGLFIAFIVMGGVELTIQFSMGCDQLCTAIFFDCNDSEGDEEETKPKEKVDEEKEVTVFDYPYILHFRENNSFHNHNLSLPHSFIQEVQLPPPDYFFIFV